MLDEKFKLHAFILLYFALLILIYLKDTTSYKQRQKLSALIQSPSLFLFHNIKSHPLAQFL